VLKRGETVAREEKLGGALGGFSSRGGEGEKNGGGSGRGGATWHGCAWGLASTGGQRPDRLLPGRGARRRRVSVSDRGAPRQLTGGPQWQWEREGEERHEQRAGTPGPAQEEKGVVEPR
jgi:hypothetical protein